MLQAVERFPGELANIKGTDQIGAARAIGARYRVTYIANCPAMAMAASPDPGSSKKWIPFSARLVAGAPRRTC